jgi:AcrR family transcriptional regulator
VPDESRDLRTEILTAAARLVMRHGVRGLTTTQVAREVGVRQSHLTYYFPTKRELLHAVMLRFLDGMLGHLETASARGLREGLRELHAMVTAPDHMRLLAGVAVEAETDEDLREVLREAVGHFDGTLARILGLEPDDPATRQLMATLWGMGLRRLLTHEPPAAGEVDRLIRSFETQDRPKRRRRS